MGPEQLRQAILARPFTKFTLRTVGGVEYRIDHPEFVALSGSGRSIAVFSVNDNAFDIVDTIMIEALVFSNEGETGSQRRSA